MSKKQKKYSDPKTICRSNRGNDELLRDIENIRMITNRIMKEFESIHKNRIRLISDIGNEIGADISEASRLIAMNFVDYQTKFDNLHHDPSGQMSLLKAGNEELERILEIIEVAINTRSKDGPLVLHLLH